MTIPRQTPSHHYNDKAHQTKLGTQVCILCFTMTYVEHLAVQVNVHLAHGQVLLGAPRQFDTLTKRIDTHLSQSRGDTMNVGYTTAIHQSFASQMSGFRQ